MQILVYFCEPWSDHSFAQVQYDLGLHWLLKPISPKVMTFIVFTRSLGHHTWQDEIYLY